MSSPAADDEFDDDSNFAADYDDRQPAASASSTPRGLPVICILAIILSVLGLLTGCVGLGSEIFTSRMKQMMARMPRQGNQQEQQDMTDRLMAITDRYKWMTLPLLAAKVVVEIMLLTGAILAIRLSPRGRSWLLAALVAALVVESLYIIPTVLVQRETQAVTSEFMAKAMAAQQGRNAAPGMENFASTFTSVVGILSIVFAIGWLGAKFIYYALSIRYLRKSELVTFFSIPSDEMPA